jgi:hypothetical protein
MERRSPSNSATGTAGWRQFRPVNGNIRVRPLALLLVTGIVVYGIITHYQNRDTTAIETSERRMPVTNSPLEPDRPDLIGEPRIDE